MAEFFVVLVEPQYEGNVGATARVMKNFGFKNLVLINPPKLDKEARRMAMHGRDVLKSAKVLRDLSELKKKYDFLVATSAVVAGDSNAMRSPIFPEQLASSADLKGKVALIFGREAYGLYSDEIKLCDVLVTIPASSEYPTLNLSQSVAVVLYELSKIGNEKNLRRLRKFRDAGKKDKDVLLENFDELTDSVYKQDFQRRVAKKTFRQLLGRAFISGREAFTLIGVLRRANNGIGKSKEKKKKRKN